MATIKTRPERTHLTYGSKVVLINLTYGHVTKSMLQELLEVAMDLAKEKNLPTVEVRFSEINPKRVEFMCTLGFQKYTTGGSFFAHPDHLVPENVSTL